VCAEETTGEEGKQGEKYSLVLVCFHFQILKGTSPGRQSFPKMRSSAPNKTTDSDVVYVGIPRARDGALPTVGKLFSVGGGSGHAVAVEPTQSKLHKSVGYGLFAFIVGAVLACFGWTANQGWSIASLLVFGEFTWTLESAWKHVLLSGLGSVFTAIAFWAVFKMIFPTVLDDDYDEHDGPSSHKRDISDALQDLGELGFVAGYCGTQIFISKLVCNNLVGLGISCEQSSTALNGVTLVFVMLWMLCTKMRDYIKAVSREMRYADCEEMACEWVQSA
jgi:hypothetical protein